MLIRRVKLAAIGVVLLMAAGALAREVQEAYPVITTAQAVIGPSPWYFFLAIVVGVILAISFELILTHLSLAAGISSVGPFDERGKPKTERGETREEGEGAVMSTVRKTSSLFGIWALVTATVSLFFASWLAVELSHSASAFVGFVLGLSIWALFYIIMTAIEVSAVTSLVGSLTHTAAEGLKSAYKATTAIFGKSEEDRIVDTAEKVTAAVREELFGDVDTDRIRKQIDKYVRQLRPASPEEIKDALRDILDETEIRALVEHGEGELADVDVLTATLETEGGMTREKARTVATNVKSAISKIRDEYGKSDKDTVSKISDAAMRVAGRSPEEAASVRQQIEDYLRKTEKEELNPEGIKRDLEKLFSRPREGLSALRERLSHVDRNTLQAVLAQRQDMSGDDAKKTTDRVMSVIDRIRGKTEETAGEVEARRRGIEAKIRDYMNSMGRPELEYEGIKHDIQTLFHDPKAGADSLIRRLKAMDRDTLKAIIASRKDVSEEDAEHIVSQMERARDETISRYERMRDEVQHRIEDAKDRALREAEETRKAARNAAWWTFGSAVASACAAIIGGILSTYT
jgi:ElaB/YqjD/DUF883 family membrane-anchored ribosome-binding protein